jgi:antitoxin component of RelBE/YafQ-DinJ toxin-antitoxin module
MKSELLQLRLGAEEKRAFQEAAELAGLPLSAWVRLRLRWAATRELEDAGLHIGFLPKPKAASHG